MADAYPGYGVQQYYQQQYQQPQITSPSPAPQAAQSAYAKNLQNWTSSSTPPPRTASAAARAQNRPSRSRATPAPQQQAQNQHQYQNYPQQYQMNYPPPPQSASFMNSTRTQALYSTYASRMRTGCTLLMQPIVTASSSNPVVQQQQQQQQQQPVSQSFLSTTGRPSRRAAAAKVSYVDQGSSAEEDEDEDDGGPDAGEKVGSEDEEYAVSGGVRTSVNKALQLQRAGSRAGTSSARASQQPQPQDAMQSYLGQEVPERLLRARRVRDSHGHGEREEHGAVNIGTNPLPSSKTSLVPITLSLNTTTHRIRDAFVWNIHESIITPRGFAKVMCLDLDLDDTYVDLIAAQIETQIEDHLEVASVELNTDPDMGTSPTEDRPECRVVISIDVHIPPSNHLLDHIEWDLLSPLQPEEFARVFCNEVGLGGEAVPLIAHAIHEELLKHKKDAMDWGVLQEAGERTAWQMRDKTGLGLSSTSGWTKGGPGPKILRSIWRDYVEAEEFQTRLQPMTEEERERRELEGERTARRLRRETSKFQSSGRATRRR